MLPNLASFAFHAVRTFALWYEELHDALVTRREQVNIVQINCSYDAEPPSDDAVVVLYSATSSKSKASDDLRYKLFTMQILDYSMQPVNRDADMKHAKLSRIPPPLTFHKCQLV
ncbi:hypothetical protein FB451DRAFT_1170561 [Mycena latifolia]|nr:hypothetical protein FB451DRAFT_1170561 [Mycena latifolia]